jgi:pilus assembly protein Flp/PilA
MLFSPKEKGQGMVEYALIIVLIAIVVIVILTLLGTQISTVFSQITSALAGTGGS